MIWSSSGSEKSSLRHAIGAEGAPLQSVIWIRHGFAARRLQNWPNPALCFFVPVSISRIAAVGRLTRTF